MSGESREDAVLATIRTAGRQYGVTGPELRRWHDLDEPSYWRIVDRLCNRGLIRRERVGDGKPPRWVPRGPRP